MATKVIVKGLICLRVRKNGFPLPKYVLACIFVKMLAGPLTGVSLNKSTTTLTVGATCTLTATITPATATNKSVTWKSSNIAVATVDSTGKVVGIRAGTATITVTTVDGSKTATCTVTVRVN